MDRLLPAEGMIFEAGKTYTHSVGLSCCFRQWRAKDTHCRFLHGYALQVTITFRTTKLDDRNWVMNFGGLKPVKAWLEETFDHKTLVAKDDPAIELLREMSIERNPVLYTEAWEKHPQLVQLVEVDHVGVEAFAKMIYDHVMWWLTDAKIPYVFVQEVEVREHEGNFARYRRDS